MTDEEQAAGSRLMASATNLFDSDEIASLTSNDLEILRADHDEEPGFAGEVPHGDLASLMQESDELAILQIAIAADLSATAARLARVAQQEIERGNVKAALRAAQTGAKIAEHAKMVSVTHEQTLEANVGLRLQRDIIERLRTNADLMRQTFEELFNASQRLGKREKQLSPYQLLAANLYRQAKEAMEQITQGDPNRASGTVLEPISRFLLHMMQGTYGSNELSFTWRQYDSVLLLLEPLVGRRSRPRH